MTRLIAPLLAALAFSVAGCHEPITQLVVVVDSDLGAPLERVRIEIGPAGAPTSERTVTAPLPFSFGIRARAQHERVRVALSALGAGDAVLARTEALLPFVPGETRRVVLHLEAACAGLVCDEGTCRAGACVDPAIPVEALEPIAPGDELDQLPPFPVADAGVDAGPSCSDTCTPDETCEGSECRCGDGPSCGEGALCDEGACVPWPRSCERAGRARGCDLVAMPGGTFVMGDERAYAEDATGAFPEQPSITVSPFAMDAYEVTVARFREFWEAGHPHPGGPVPYPGDRAVSAGDLSEPTRTADSAECNWSPEPGARELHPINCVTWSTALAFCAWDGGRLPTEAEWEWAARGRPVDGLAAGRRFPWGDEVPAGTEGASCTRAHAFGCSGADGAGTREVGSYAPAAGVYDQTGNVAELTADHYDLYGVGPGMCWRQQAQTDPLCRLSSGEVAFRGGGYGAIFVDGLMGAARARTDGGAYAGLGLRCVR